jgi:hypothetical protein
MKKIITKNLAIIVICPISKERGHGTMQQLSMYVTALHTMLEHFSNPVM